MWHPHLPIGSRLQPPVLEFNHGLWSSRAYACVQIHHGAQAPSSSEQAFLPVCCLRQQTPSQSQDWLSLCEAPYQALEHKTAWIPMLLAQRVPFMLSVSSSLAVLGQLPAWWSMIAWPSRQNELDAGQGCPFLDGSYRRCCQGWMARWKQTVPVLGQPATFELVLDLQVLESLLEHSPQMAVAEQKI
jgi:hypothetical protein